MTTIKSTSNELINEVASEIRVWFYRNDFDARCCAEDILGIYRKHWRDSRPFYVLERFKNGQSQGYWNGESSRSFISDIDSAIQFRRQQDALPIKSSWHWTDVEITEHLYMPTEVENDD